MEHEDAPLLALSDSSLAILEDSITHTGVVRNGRLNNYVGLMELAELSTYEKTLVKESQTHMKTFVDEWTNHNKKMGKPVPTVGELYQMLASIDRRDVQETWRQTLSEDVHTYNRNIEAEAKDNGVFQPIPDVVPRNERYDAFIAYADEDLVFVKRLLEKLEGPKYRFKLYIQDRDEIPGSSIYSTRAKIIEQSCRKVIVVISKAFLKDESCEFALRFAQSLTPAGRKKKIVPVYIENNVHPPRLLSFLSRVDFTRMQEDDAAGITNDWEWNRLCKSLAEKTPNKDVRYPENNQNIHNSNEDCEHESFGLYELCVLPVPDSTQDRKIDPLPRIPDQNQVNAIHKAADALSQGSANGSRTHREVVLNINRKDVRPGKSENIAQSETLDIAGTSDFNNDIRRSSGHGENDHMNAYVLNKTLSEVVRNETHDISSTSGADVMATGMVNIEQASGPDGREIFPGFIDRDSGYVIVGRNRDGNEQFV